MTRYTTFKFCLDPTADQECALARHAGAARFAFNQCLRMAKDGLDDRRTDAAADVPFTAIDFINAFNGWKKSEPAGRLFAVDKHGTTEMRVTGLELGAITCVNRCSRVVPAIALELWLLGGTHARARGAGLTSGQVQGRGVRRRRVILRLRVQAVRAAGVSSCSVGEL